MKYLNKEELRKMLTEVYENFYKGNYSKEMIQKAIEIDRLYGGAIDLLDDVLGDAIYLLTFIIQKEMPGGENKKEEAKKILEKLKSAK